MKPIFSPLERISYALLRFMAGAMMSFHGMQKIFGILTEKDMPEVGSQLWIGGLIELVLGGLVALGLFTSLAAFILSGTMAVAYFQFHWDLQFDKTFFPIVNGGELAVLYCFVFLFLSTRGNGILSVGSQREKKKAAEKADN